MGDALAMQCTPDSKRGVIVVRFPDGQQHELNLAQALHLQGLIGDAIECLKPEGNAPPGAGIDFTQRVS